MMKSSELSEKYPATCVSKGSKVSHLHKQTISKHLSTWLLCTDEKADERTDSAGVQPIFRNESDGGAAQKGLTDL
jgi:hypothetical protein